MVKTIIKLHKNNNCEANKNNIQKALTVNEKPKHEYSPQSP